MLKIRSEIGKPLKGIIFINDKKIGECDNAMTFIDMLCQIKQKKIVGCSMKIEANTGKDEKKTYTYRFTKEGRMIP